MFNYFEEDIIAEELERLREEGIVDGEEIPENIKMYKEEIHRFKKSSEELKKKKEELDKKRKELDNILEFLGNFIAENGLETPISTFIERYKKIKNNIGQVKDIENKINYSKNIINDNSEKLLKNKKEIERLERFISILKKGYNKYNFENDDDEEFKSFFIKNILTKKPPYDFLYKEIIINLEKKIIDLKNINKDLKERIKNEKEYLPKLEELRKLRLQKLKIIKIFEGQSKTIEEITKKEIYETIEKIKTDSRDLEVEILNIEKKQNSKRKIINVKLEEIKRFEEILKNISKRLADYEVKILRSIEKEFEKIEESGKPLFYDIRELKYAVFQHLNKQEYVVLNITEKDLGSDIGMFLAIYNKKKKKVEEIILKLYVIKDIIDKKDKIAEKIYFEIMGEDIAPKKELSLHDNEKIVVTSSKIVSGLCRNLYDFCEYEENMPFFIENEDLNSSMFDLLTMSIAINSKDFRSDNIVIDCSNPDSLKAYNIDIQTSDLWSRVFETKRISFDLDRVSSNKKVRTFKKFGRIFFPKNANLTKFTCDFHSLGQVYDSFQISSDFGTIFEEDKKKPLLDVFDLISSDPESDFKLKQSFARTARKLLDQLAETDDKLKIKKLRQALGRCIKFNNIVKNNCGKNLFHPNLLKIIRSHALNLCEINEKVL